MSPVPKPKVKRANPHNIIIPKTPYLPNLHDTILF